MLRLNGREVMLDGVDSAEDVGGRRGRYRVHQIMNTHVRDNLKAIGDAWTSFTPTVGGGWSLGNGTAAGNYLTAGKLVMWHATITAGSTTTFGTTPQIGTPVTMAGPIRSQNGTALLFDSSSSAIHNAFARLNSTTVVVIKMTGTSGNDNITSTTPFTWATSDELNVSMVGEAA